MIRLFDSKDVDACEDIVTRCLRESVNLSQDAREYLILKFTKPGYWESLANTYPLFVYENNSQVLATGGIYNTEIHKMYVDPNYQGKGIGTKMINHLVNIANKLEYRELHLCSWESSASFYENQGFNIVNRRNIYENDVGMLVLEMRMDI